MGKAYYGKKDYETALDFIRRSLYIFEDELGYLMYGKILRRLRRKEEALEYLKKSFFFLENEDFNFSIRKKEVEMSSIVPKEGMTEKEIEVLYELIQCNIAFKDFEAAYTVTQVALKKYPSNEKFLDLDDTISAFIDMENKNNILAENITKMKKEYKSAKADLSKNMCKMRNWAVDLMKIQGMDIELTEDDNQWSIFEKRMDVVINKMKEDSNYKRNKKYKEILQELSLHYPTLSEESVNTLATGEFLYESNKNTTIDFAPIVVAMSKCFEIEINKRLNLVPKKTIGQLKYYIKDMISNYEKIYELLEKIRVLRNNSAHTGATTRETVEELRELIYGENGINYVLSFFTEA
ncbi:protein of unknown function [Clostridium sp. DSM 8431]|uniref:tetratricopeptide repeat protein n=1 Tax=Clostridium sp. DSM 8431 TaxID=1761781 RepID=UPI0008E17A2E|nr:tetratricopeptide repeat protein [Clostridium sp. DSM 8431]SFU85533.1 protein of unknown function [Clostridium sp. DSM 8431]